eukprot:SAG22_NODE_291_length_12933_cov_5.599657_5_plen_171_part_00
MYWPRPPSAAAPTAAAAPGEQPAPTREIPAACCRPSGYRPLPAHTAHGGADPGWPGRRCGGGGTLPLPAAVDARADLPSCGFYTERTVTYDTDAYPLRELLRAIILPAAAPQPAGHASATGSDATIAGGLLPLEEYHENAAAAEYLKALLSNLSKVKPRQRRRDRTARAS